MLDAAVVMMQQYSAAATLSMQMAGPAGAAAAPSQQATTSNPSTSTATAGTSNGNVTNLDELERLAKNVPAAECDTNGVNSDNSFNDDSVNIGEESNSDEAEVRRRRLQRFEQRAE